MPAMRPCGAAAGLVMSIFAHGIDQRSQIHGSNALGKNGQTETKLRLYSANLKGEHSKAQQYVWDSLSFSHCCAVLLFTYSGPWHFIFSFCQLNEKAVKASDRRKPSRPSLRDFATRFEEFFISDTFLNGIDYYHDGKNCTSSWQE